jgi:hypothetical protein
MASQQQHQNLQRPGELDQRPIPGNSPGHTIPGQSNQNPGDQHQEHIPGEQGAQNRREQRQELQPHAYLTDRR